MSKIKFFYFCYSHNVPTGGQKHTYQHVDILNRNGFDATIVHPGNNFRLTWFANDTKVISLDEFKIICDPRQDIVVLPEDLGAQIKEFPGKKVVFNKNLYWGFTCFSKTPQTTYPYQHPEVIAALCVSEHNLSHMKFAFPSLQIERVYGGIDIDIFNFRPLHTKERQIACSIKSPDSTLTVLHMLQARSNSGLNKAESFHWKFIEGRSEKEVAKIFEESLIYLSFSTSEGLPRMSLEAMASGCIPIQFGSGPLSEIASKEMCIEHGDLISAVKQIEDITERYPDNFGDWLIVTNRNRLTAEQFSLKRQEESVLSAWDSILSRN